MILTSYTSSFDVRFKVDFKVRIVLSNFESFEMARFHVLTNVGIHFSKGTGVFMAQYRLLPIVNETFVRSNRECESSDFLSVAFT